MNYIGSKRSLMDFLQHGIDEVSGFRDGDRCVFADLFAGTGAVGANYRSRGCTVLSNDLQYYSYVLNKHYIEYTPRIDNGLLDRLNSLPGVDGFVYRNYCLGSGSGRNYFSDENGRRCDAVRQEIERMRLQGEIADDTYYLLLASLIQSIDKFANTASIYGAFLKKLKSSARKDFRMEFLPVVSGPAGHVFNEDVNALVGRISGDILYLDPPYNSRQYCGNYHVLETIARYDSPVLTGVTGMRDTSSQKSSFCSKRTVASSFEDIVSRADFRYVFMSYNNEGLMDPETIRSIMSRYGRYSFYAKDYRRFKADTEENRSIAADSTVEYLHCLAK